MDVIQNDFDRLAAFEDDGWSHNRHYEPYLLRYVPPGCRSALDAGCGGGSFSRLLAARCARVLAVDLSPGMLRVARRRSASFPNIEFRQADLNCLDLPPESFDVIASLAVLHHLPFEPAVAMLKRLLRPGGTLLILDLYEGGRPADYLQGILALPVSILLRLLKTGRLRLPPAERAAWAEHGRHDRYLPLAEVRRLGAAHLPGAAIRRHLLWRYSIVWKKGEEC